MPKTLEGAARELFSVGNYDNGYPVHRGSIPVPIAVFVCEDEARHYAAVRNSLLKRYGTTAIEEDCAALATDDGTVRVPREPTEAMMRAGDDAIMDGMQKAQLGIPYGLHPEHACWNVYRAMLAAHDKERNDGC